MAEVTISSTSVIDFPILTSFHPLRNYSMVFQLQYKNLTGFSMFLPKLITFVIYAETWQIEARSSDMQSYL